MRYDGHISIRPIKFVRLYRAIFGVMYAGVYAPTEALSILLHMDGYDRLENAKNYCFVDFGLRVV